MERETIKILINSLNEDECKKIQLIKNQYTNARLTIQEFCDHLEVESILSGMICVTCGKIIKYNHPCIKQYIKKD